MVMLHKRINIIDHIDPTLWDMWLLKELFYNGNYTSLTIYTYIIMIDLMNKVLIFSYKKMTLPVI